MKKFSELSLSCKAGVIAAVTVTPFIIYKSAKLVYKWYQHKYRKVYVSNVEINEEDTTNTDIEVNL